MKFSQDLQETMKYLNNELHTDRNFDVVYRVLTIGGKNACLYFIDGFTKDDRYFYFRIQKDGETVIVENEIGVGFTNEPIPTPTPEYPDSPKTGDDSKLWLWILLASGSLTVLITVSIVSRKKRKAL